MTNHPRPSPPAYSRAQWAGAVLLAAILGWAAIVLPSLLALHLNSQTNILESFLLLLIFGLPIAFLFALVFIAYPLRILMRRPVSYRRALVWGCLMSLTLALLYVALARLHGLHISRDPTFDAQIGGGDYVRSIDGLLTPYGWWVSVRNTVTFVLGCTLAALLIRRLLGPGDPADQPDAEVQR